MGSVFSSTDSQNPNSSPDSPNPTTIASDLNSPESDQSTTPAVQNSEEDNRNAAEQGEDDVEEGECGFCLFMKGGGCKDAFTDWENCIKEAETEKTQVSERCFDATAALRKCMQAHPDYYEPILKAERAAEEELKKELEKEEIDSKQKEKDMTADFKDSETAVAQSDGLEEMHSKQKEKKMAADFKDSETAVAQSDG